MGLLWSRRFDNGRGEVQETEIPLDGSSTHITQFDRQTNSRVSWETNSSDENSAEDIHYTDQNLRRKHSDRHDSSGTDFDEERMLAEMEYRRKVRNYGVRRGRRSF